MALIKTMTPENAVGRVAEVYKMFETGSGKIPGPLFVLSATPKLFEHYTNTFEYWMTQTALSRDLMACIRYLVSVQHDFPACVEFNEHLLTAAGMTKEELAAMGEDPRQAPLEEKELEMLAFVLEATREPQKITQAHVDKLKEYGWTDGQIVDATYHGSVLLAMGVLVGTFAK